MADTRFKLKQLDGENPNKILTTDASGNVVAVEEFPLAGVIGDAEDLDYTDGLFTDFIPTTPVGTAVDRFNEILKFLVPPPAPDLSDWSATKAVQELGNLSFDSSNPIAEDTYFGTDSGPSPSPSPVLVDGLWDTSGKRLGISGENAGDVTGVLNDQVTQHPQTPTPAYEADMFGEADQGELRMIINGVTKTSATLDLTSSTGSIDTTLGGTQSGFVVSAQEFSKFAQGDDFTFFVNRTGTWLVVDDDVDLRLGYNYVIVEHDTGSTVKTLNRFEWIVDGNTVATAYSNSVLDNLSMTGAKRLSGIEYHTGGTVLYDIDIDNAYRNTYSDDGDAISFIGTRCTAPAQALATSGGNELKQVNIVNKTVTIDSGIRIINSSIDIRTQVKRTVQATTSGGLETINNILMDDVSSSSTQDDLEDFNNESFRLTTASNYNLTTDVAANPWDSDQSLDDGAAGHTDGLQVTEGKLIYPNSGGGSLDYTTTNVINGPVFNDGGTGGGARDYTSLTGTRSYVRFFRLVSPTTANFVMQINGSGGTFRALGDTTGTDWIHVEIKGPSETGWMDAYSDFSTGQTGDGDGARSATAGAGRAFGTNWGLTIGTKSTANTDGYMLIRITVPDTFTGEFTSIDWTFVV